jgi:hypothetical protein
MILYKTDRVARGITTLSEEELGNRHQRGFLFDNRSSDKLTVRLFSAMTDTIFIDAPFVLEISKSQDGGLTLTTSVGNSRVP